MSALISVTLATSTDPARLSKAFWLDEQGALQKEQGGKMYAGSAEVRRVDITDFPALLQSLTPAQALIFGQPLEKYGDAVELTTSNRFEQGKCKRGAIPRTTDYFEWSSGPATLLLDYDPADGQAPLTRDELQSALEQAVPALATVPIIMADSASSHIYSKGGECLKGAGGIHAFIPVRHGTEIPAIGARLVSLLRLHGHIYDTRNKSHARLQRTLIDAVVWQPNRLSFDAGAACGDGLEQRRPAPSLVRPDAPFLSLSDLPPLNGGDGGDHHRGHSRSADEAQAAEGADTQAPETPAPKGEAPKAATSHAFGVKKSGKSQPSKKTTEKVLAALKFIPADINYEIWIQIAFALKHAYGEKGFEIWKEWSQSVPDADSTSRLQTVWAGIRDRDAGAVTLGTLFYYGKLHGWVPAPDEPDNKPWRRAEEVVKAVPTVDIDIVRQNVKTGLQEMLDQYEDWFRSEDESDDDDEQVRFAPWLFQSTTGSSKSTLLRGLSSDEKLRDGELRIVVGVPNHDQAQEYEDEGWFHFWGRQAEVKKGCGSATQGDALCYAHAEMTRATELNHVPAAEFCTKCSHGLAWSIKQAESEMLATENEKRKEELQERIDRHGETLRSRGLNPDGVPPCKWLSHNAAVKKRQFVVIVSQSYNHGLVGKALYLHDEGFAVGKSVDATMNDLDAAAKTNLAQMQALQDAGALAFGGDAAQKARWRLHDEADEMFKFLGGEIARWVGRTGVMQADESLMNAVGKLLESSKKLRGSHGVELAAWEKLAFDDQGGLKEAPLRFAFALAETLMHSCGYIENGSLQLSASNAIIERIAMGLPTAIFDATPDRVVSSIVESRGGRVIRAIAKQRVAIHRYPARLWGLTALNESRVKKDRVEKEIARYKKAMKHFRGLYGEGDVAFLMSKAAYDLLYPNAAECPPENVGYWGKDHRAHDNWFGKHLVIFGSFYPPMSEWRRMYQVDRLAAMAAGCHPNDWPVWPDDLKMLKNTWINEGWQDVQSRLPLPDNERIRRWLLTKVSNEIVQAVGRSRGACLLEEMNEFAHIHIFGGVPLYGLGAHGLEVEDYSYDGEDIGKTKKQADAEAREAGIAVLDKAAEAVIKRGDVVTRAALEAEIEGKNHLCRQGISTITKAAQIESCLDDTGIAPHERVYQDWFSRLAPAMSKYMSDRGRKGGEVRAAREILKKAGEAALKQALEIAESLWNLRVKAGEDLRELAEKLVAAVGYDEDQAVGAIMLDVLDGT